MINVLVLLLILTILVLVHEFGHFLVARKFGIKVEEFGLGFPPRIFAVKKGETEYSVNWIFFGGFVKLYGEDDAGGGRINLKEKVLQIKNKGRAFFAKPWWQRALVALAGVVMNFLLAALLFYGALGLRNFTVDVPLIFDHSFQFVNQSVTSEIIIFNVSDGSPAKDAGIRPGSKVITLDDVTPENTVAFREAIDASRGKAIVLTLEDLEKKETYTVTVIPRVNPPEGQGAVGIALDDYTTARLSYDTPLQKAFSGFIHTWNMTTYNLKIFGNLIGTSVAKRSAEPVSTGVTGPIGIGVLVGDILAIPDIGERIHTLLTVSALISLSLAILNILPFPALDGGRLFFILIEGVTGRRVNATFERRANTIGFILLFALMILVTYRDFLRFVLVR